MFKLIRLTVFILALAKCGQSTSLQLLPKTPNNNLVKCTCTDGSNYDKTPSGSLISTFGFQTEYTENPNLLPPYSIQNEYHNFPYTNWELSGSRYPIPMDVHSIKNEAVFPGYPIGQNGYEMIYPQIPRPANSENSNLFNSVQSPVYREGPKPQYFPGQDINQMTFPNYGIENPISGIIPTIGTNFWNTLSPNLLKIPWNNNGQFPQPHSANFMGKSNSNPIKGTPHSSTSPIPNFKPNNNLQPNNFAEISKPSLAPLKLQTVTSKFNLPSTAKPVESSKPQNINPPTNQGKHKPTEGVLNPLNPISTFDLRSPLASGTTNFAGPFNPVNINSNLNDAPGFSNLQNLKPEISRGYMSNIPSSTNINSNINLAGAPNPANVNSWNGLPLFNNGYITSAGPTDYINGFHDLSFPSNSGSTELSEINVNPDINLVGSSNPVVPGFSFPSYSGYTTSTGSISPINLSPPFELPSISGYTKLSGVSVNPTLNGYVNLAGSSNPVDINSGFSFPSFSGYTNLEGPSNIVNANPEYSLPSFSGYTSLVGSSNPVDINSAFSFPSFSGFTNIEGPTNIVNTNPEYSLPSFSGYTSLVGSSNPVDINSAFNFPSFSGFTNIERPSNIVNANPGYSLPSFSGYTNLAGSSNPVDINSGYNLPAFNGYTNFKGPSNAIDLNPEYSLPSFSDYGNLPGVSNPVEVNPSFNGYTNTAESSNPINLNPEGFLTNKLSLSAPNVNFNTLPGSSNSVNVNPGIGMPSISSSTYLIGSPYPQFSFPVNSGNSNLAGTSKPEYINEFSFPSFNGYTNFAGSFNPPYLKSWLGLPAYSSYINSAGYSNPFNLNPELKFQTRKYNSDFDDIPNDELANKIGSSPTNTNVNINTNTNLAGLSNNVKLKSEIAQQNPAIVGSINSSGSIPGINLDTNLAGSSNPSKLNSGLQLSSGNLAGNLVPNMKLSTTSPSASTGSSTTLNLNPALGSLAGSLIPNKIGTSSTNTNININANTNSNLPSLNTAGNGNLNPKTFNTIAPNSSTKLSGSFNTIKINPTLSSSSGSLGGSSASNIKLSSISPSASFNSAGLNFTPAIGLASENLSGALGSSSTNTNVNINTNSAGTSSFSSLLPNINLGVPSTNLNTGIGSTLTGSLNPSKINLNVPTVSAGTNLVESSNPLNVNLGVGTLVPKLTSSSANVNVNTNAARSGIDLLQSTRSFISKEESSTGSSAQTGEIPNLLSGLNINNKQDEKPKLPDLRSGLDLVANAVSSAASAVGINPDSKSNGLLGGLGFF